MISLIVPVYNAENEIKTCVQSLCQQSYATIEILLIDDGSTDRTGEICDGLVSTDTRIRVLHTQNNGQGQARNIGVKNARGDYIAFVDADDYLPKKALEYLLAPLKIHPFDIIAGAYDRKAKGKKVRIQACTPGRLSRRGAPEERQRYHAYKTTSGFGYVWGKLYRRDFLERCGVGFNRQKKAFMEDSLFNTKLMAYSPSYYVIGQGVYVYNVIEGSTSNQKRGIGVEARSVLNNYGRFLKERHGVQDNIDLAIPLGFRIVLWTLYKEWEAHGMHMQRTGRILQEFFSMNVLRQWLDTPGAMKACVQVSPPQEKVMYLVLYIGAKWRATRFLSALFMMGRPILMGYVHRKVRGNI